MSENLIIYIGPDRVSGTFFDGSGSEKRTIDKDINMIIDEEIVEQDPEEWYTAVMEIIEEIKASGQNIMDNISITYDPGTFVCIDRSGRPVINAILPYDRRAKYQVHICEKNSKKHSENTNIPWKHMILPKLLWIRYNKPDVFRNIFKVLTPDGYLSYRMTGETAIDNYSAVLLGYNLNTNSYNKKLLGSLGLDSSMFPQVKRAGECSGVIDGNIREELKLTSEVKFIISSNYLIPLLYASATRDEDEAAVDLESLSICFRDNHGKIKNERIVTKFILDGQSIYGIIGNNEMLFLKWLNRVFRGAECSDQYHIPGSNGIIVLPYMMGDSSLYKSDIKGSIIGISDNNPCDIITAAYEAVGYIIKERIDYICGHDININSLKIYCSIYDRLFYQIISDITGKKVLFSCSSKNIKKYVNKIISKIDIPEDQEDEISVSPDEENNSKYKQLYSLYKNAYESLDNLFKYRRKTMKNI